MYLSSLLLGCTLATTTLPSDASATSCVGTDRTPSELVAGAPPYRQGDGTLWELFDLAITGTVTEIRTEASATEVRFQVINAMGVSTVPAELIVSESDPGHLNGYGFQVGRTYFVPLVSPGPNGEPYWSFVCDPISEIPPEDADRLLSAAIEGVATAVPRDVEASAPTDPDTDNAPDTETAADTETESPATRTEPAADAAIPVAVKVSVAIAVAVVAASAVLVARTMRRRKQKAP